MLTLKSLHIIKIFFSPSAESSSGSSDSCCDVWLIRFSARYVSRTALFISSRDEYFLSASIASVWFSGFALHQKSIKFSAGLVNKMLLFNERLCCIGSVALRLLLALLPQFSEGFP